MVGVEGEGDLALQTVTVEDKTSAVVVWGIHAGDTRTTWNHLPDISGRDLNQAIGPPGYTRSRMTGAWSQRWGVAFLVSS